MNQDKPNNSDDQNNSEEQNLERGDDTFPAKNSKNIRFDNTERDEGTLGVSKDRETDPGLADEDQPKWQPPESIPEPRPADPIMKTQ